MEVFQREERFSLLEICLTFHTWYGNIIRCYADMAELADAYGSGPYVSNYMQVQVLLSAP